MLRKRNNSSSEIANGTVIIMKVMRVMARFEKKFKSFLGLFSKLLSELWEIQNLNRDHDLL
jgi:hypothetical protein